MTHESIITNLPQRQKELMSGRYEIMIKKSLPYSNKLIKLAEEPVAYHLYKMRHEQLNELTKPEQK